MSTEAVDSDLSAALDRLHTHLDRLEAKITPQANGAASTPAAHLADPQIQAAMDRILARIDKLEAMIDTLGTLGQRLPVLAEAAGSTASWAWDQAVAQGVDPIQAGQRTAALALAAGHPDNLALAERLLARGGTLSATLDALDQVDDAELIGLLQRLLARRHTLSALLDALDQLDDADVEAVADALVATRRESAPEVGPVAAFFRLGDPDVKRAIGFSLELAKRMGAILRR